jgi:hypothetical protein
LKNISHYVIGNDAKQFINILDLLWKKHNIDKYSTWKSIIDELTLKKDPHQIIPLMVDARSRFVSEMNNEICPKLCFFDGSTNPRSDIDIAIKNRIESLDILKNVNKYIGNTFIEIFPKNTVRYARKFLDLNHYISDFNISSWDLRSCVKHISDNNMHYYLSCQDNWMQRFFSLMYWREVQESLIRKPLRDVCYNYFKMIQERSVQDAKSCVKQNGMDNYTIYVCLYQNMMDKLQNCGIGNQAQDIDDIANILSLMSNQEDEGYRTQASFYRWVKKLKNIPYYMQIDCILEHFCMANAHGDDKYSYCKYLSRAVNTAREMDDQNIHSKFAGDWWDRVYLYIGKKSKFELEKDHSDFVDSIIASTPKSFNLETFTRELYNAIDKSRDYHFPTDHKQGGATNDKVFILGRHRKVHKIGRKKWVKYQGRLIPLSEARVLTRKPR